VTFRTTSNPDGHAPREHLSVLIATWASGGNLPPLLALARLLRAAGHRVQVLASDATRAPARRDGFESVAYRAAPQPDVSAPFEAQAARVLRTLAGVEVARDVYELLEETRPDVLVADCMLPAAAVAAQAASTPVVSLVHFLYGLARSQMAGTNDGWTTDLTQLNRTRARFGLPPASDGLAAWEAVELLLVTSPRWFDLDISYPPNVVHAGPLGVRAMPASREGRSLVAASFSTTAMAGQAALLQRVCDAFADEQTDAVLTLGGMSLEPFAAPRNVEVVPFSDHDELFPRCAAVVSHGGLGTVLRALAHGVPLLLLPLGRDQHINAGRVARLGAGIHLASTAPTDRIRRALEQLTVAPDFREAAAAAAVRIAAGEPDRSALQAVEAAATRTPRHRPLEQPGVVESTNADQAPT
jgi:UDP:flavonoid glycosyltransferase YjiC (YdhE family)